MATQSRAAKKTDQLKAAVALAKNQVQMKRWWRLTSTKKSIGKNTGNAAADAAAVAIAHMLREAKKMA
ncbi:MAG: hypothetical protein WCQ91_03575 [Planctomycetota bacterium]